MIESFMKYRIASKDDDVQLAQMRWDFRAEDGEIASLSKEEFIAEYTVFFHRGVASGNHTHWIAEDESGIVAHMLVQKIEMVPRPCRVSDHFGYLTDVYTKPAYRNRGIGSELLNRVKQWAQGEELEILVVWAGDAALPFYNRHGFAPNEEIVECKFREY